jgi:predicted XRE-type DNA-binding protein
MCFRAIFSPQQFSLASKGLSQSQTTMLFLNIQPRIANLMRGKINMFRLDALLNMSAATGLDVEMRALESV